MSTQKKLLCIDDEENGLKLRKLLFEREGHQVLTAADGPRSANQTPALRAISSRQLYPRGFLALPFIQWRCASLFVKSRRTALDASL